MPYFQCIAKRRDILQRRGDGLLSGGEELCSACGLFGRVEGKRFSAKERLLAQVRKTGGGIVGLKAEIFGALDRITKPGTILATNTSYLDVNAIAAMVGILAIRRIEATMR